MGEDEGPDSDSSGREFCKNFTRTRSRRPKEARVCYSSRTTTMSLEDPMPEYVDPELVKLIAQNAPFELDLFVHSLRHNSTTKRRAENGGTREGGAVKEGERRPLLPVEALLSSVRERSGQLSARSKAGQDVRHSCPERMWRDFGENDEESICRAKAVKRKRPKGSDGYRLPPVDRPCPTEVSLRMSDNKVRSELGGAALGNPVASGGSSDGGPNCLEDECFHPLKADALEVSSVPAPHSAGKDCDVLNAKPWRHGMRKCSSATKVEKPPPDSACCKRKAETADSRKNSEVRKYMETKMLERRKEQQQLKAEADAALVARKEQQRKLDLHRQATFQSQVSGGKSREHIPRPAWVSEYSSLCEPPRPWSSSSGELNTYLPPPVTPPKSELVPLDLYATPFQYAEGHPSIPRVDGFQLQNARPREKRRSRKAKGCSREVQRQLKYRKSQIMNEFPSTDLELTKLANSPVTRKARWKGKTKPRGRELSSEEFFPMQPLEHDEATLPRRSGDLEVYKRSLKRQFYGNGGSLCKASRSQNSTSRVSPKAPTKSTRSAESCVKSPIKDHVRPLSKVKRLKPTERFSPCKTEDFTGEELATLLNANGVPSDCESETNLKVNGQVVMERMIVRTSPTSPASEQETITDLRKCVGHSLGSPQKISTDEDVLCKWFGPSLECPEKHLIDEDVLLQVNRGQMLDNSFKPSRSKELQLQVLEFQKEKFRDSKFLRATTRKDPTMAARLQRMQLLKNLAEQLVKRVNAACAKKRQIERSAVEQINSPSMDIEAVPTAESSYEVYSLESNPKMDNQLKLNNGLSSTHLKGSIFDEKFRESELKFFHHHHPKENNVLHCTGLTEQEQAGCGILSVQRFGMELKIKQCSSISPKIRRGTMSAANDHKLAGGPVSSEICTMMDWNTTGKGSTDITCNNPSACSSLGSSSPSTGSSSPVILPTSSKYHLGRIKHGKIVSNDDKTRRLSKKLDWIIPADNDTHSIFNLYTQHLKNREKLATGTFPHVIQNDLEKMEIYPGIVERAAEENVSTVASIPLSQKVTMLDVPVRPPEPMSPRVHAHRSHEITLSPESVGKASAPGPQRKKKYSSSNFESLQNIRPGADKDAVRPTTEINILKTDAMELAGINPEVTILEIKDLKLCQSSTSFHPRMDRCQDNREDTKAKEQKLVDISHMPNVSSCTEPSPNTCVGSKQETRGQDVSNLIPPMKVTYARRVHFRAMPDGGCTDERVVVELHQMNAEVPAVHLQANAKLDSPELDASEEAPQGPASSQLHKGIGNAQSEVQGKSATKHSTVKKDLRKKHIVRKIKGNEALQPVIDQLPDHNKLVESERETGSPCTMMTCQKGELTTQSNYSSKPGSQVDLRDSQEWELKLRRDQLEAELQKLDAEIMKTRARLHQRHAMIDSQVHSVSSSPLAEQPVERPLKLDKPSNIQKRSAKHLVNKERDNVVLEQSSDLQMQKMVSTSHWSPKSRRDEEKTITSSNSYSDSFVSVDTEMGQKIILGTGTCDSVAGHPLSRKTINNICGKSFREPKTQVHQQFEGALEDRPRGNQSNDAIKRQLEAQSHCKTQSTQDDFASEGSEMSTGRGPGRRLDMPPPQVDSEENAAARHRIISQVRPIIPVIPDQMVAINVGQAQLCVKDEGNNVLESRTATCIGDGLLGAVQDSVDTKDNSRRRESRITHDSSPQKIEGKVTRDERQTSSFEQNARIPGERGKSYELPECGSREESPSSAVQCRSRNTESSNNPMPLGARICSLAGTTTVEISNGNKTLSSCIQQDGWPMKGKQQGNVATRDAVEQVLPCPIGPEQKAGRISSTTAVPSTTFLLSSSWTTSENGSGVVPGRELGKESQTNGEETMVTKRTALPGSCHNAKTLVSAEDSFLIVAAAEELPCPQHLPVGESDEYIMSVVPSMRNCLLQTSQNLMENAGQTLSQCKIGPTNKVNGQMKAMLDGGKASTCSHEEGKMSDEAAAKIVPQFVPASSWTPVSSTPCGFTTKEADWQCLNLPSHMDFSTIKEKLRNNKLADEDLLPISNGWSNYQNESLSASISEEVGGDSSGVQTVASERIISSDVCHDSKNFLNENSSTPEIGQAVKSLCRPEMVANPKNGFLPLPCRSDSNLNIKADPNNQFSDDTQGLIMPPESSSRELPNFFPSLYFRQGMIKSSNPSEEMESTISEDLENYESDIDEELQADTVSSGCNLEISSSRKASSPFPSNAFTSTRSDSAYCVDGVGSLNIKICHSESSLWSVTNGLTSRTDQVCKSSSLIDSIIDQDLTVVRVCEPCATASRIGKPSTKVLSRQSENPTLSLLHAGDQYKSQPAAYCTSPGHPADAEVIGSSHSIRTPVNEDGSNLLKITRVSNNYRCGSEASHGLHLQQSETISEEVRSVVDSETSSYCSEPQRENNIHRVDLVALNTREESHEVDDTQKTGVDDAGKHYAYNAMVSSSAPSEPPDFNENRDRHHYSVGIAGFTTTAETVMKDNPDINFSTDYCIATATNFQEMARSGNNSHHHAVLLGSHFLGSESSKKPIDLPLSFIIPQLIFSENSTQCNNVTHSSSVSSFEKLSCANDYQVGEILREDEKHLFGNTSTYNKLVTGTPRNASPGGSISSRGEMVKTANTILSDCEPIDRGTICNLDVASVEGSPIRMQKTVVHVEASVPLSYQMRPIQGRDAKDLAVDVVHEGDFKSEKFLAAELEEMEQLSDETHNLSNNFTATGSSSDKDNATNIIVGDGDNESAVVVSRDGVLEYAKLGLKKGAYLDKKGHVVSIPLDCGSQSNPTTFSAKDILEKSCLDLLIGTSENQRLAVECTIADVESKSSFNSFCGDHGDLATTSAPHMAPADRDLNKTENSYRSQNISLTPDQMIAPQACQANKFSSTSLLGNQQLVIDFDKDAVENQAHDESCNRQVNVVSDCTKTTADFEGQKNKIHSPLCSLPVLQTHLPSQHGTLSESYTNYCSSKKGFLLEMPEHILRGSSAKEVLKLPLAEGVDGCASDIWSCNVLLKSAQENVDTKKTLELSRCDDVGCPGTTPIGCSDVPEEQVISTALPEASCCSFTSSDALKDLGGIMQNIRIQVDARRVERRIIMTDIVTSLIYEDLLSVELSGFHQEVERIPTSLETSGPMNQSAKMMKAFNPKVKSRSRKVSEFCLVLKHFLPIGWRSASIRHKTGLFLHVDGLRPHPLNPATRAMPGSLKVNVQYPCYRQSEHFPKTSTNQFLLLDFSDVHSYVQRSLELSDLILDPSPTDWYDPKKPVGEHVFSAVESQLWEASHIFEHGTRQIHAKLISDLINETLLEQFATKLLVPSFGMSSLPLPAGGENLVQSVTNGIVEHERYASKHGFDIEKVIAKAFEDEQWEKCSEAATDIVGDLAQDILGDLIERFVYEMIRGWCYYIDQCHVLAT